MTRPTGRPAVTAGSAAALGALALVVACSGRPSPEQPTSSVSQEPDEAADVDRPVEPASAGPGPTSTPPTGATELSVTTTLHLTIAERTVEVALRDNPTRSTS